MSCPLVSRRRCGVALPQTLEQSRKRAFHFNRRQGRRNSWGRIASPGEGIGAGGLLPVQIMPLGDSLAVGFNSTGTVGWRRDTGYLIQNSGYGVDLVGPFQTGVMPDPDHNAVSGAASGTIKNNFLNALGTGSPAYRPRVTACDMGINDVAIIGTGGVAAAATVNANLVTMQTAAMAFNPAHQFLYLLLGPIKPGTTGELEWALFNNEFTKAGGWRDKWNSDGAWGSALFPNNKIELGDIAAWLGGAWDTTLYGGDQIHWADPGWVLIQPAFITLLRTSTILGIRSFAPSINALSATLTSPTAGTNVTYGVVTNITGVSARAKQDVTITAVQGVSTTLGTATVDQYTSAITYAWAPVIGDLGPQTIHFHVIDNQSGATYDTPNVNVTVVAPANYNVAANNIYASVPVLRDWFSDAPGTITIATGVSSWLDWVNSGNAAQATGGLQPVYTAADATLNNKGSVGWDGIDDYLNDTVLNLPAPATQNIWESFVFKFRTWTSGDHLFGCGSTTYRFGQLAGATSPQVFAHNGTLSGALNATLGSWFYGEIFWSGSAADYMKIGAGTATGNWGNNDPGAGVFMGARNVAGFGDVLLARRVITQGSPTGAEILDGKTRMSSYYNNIPAV